MMAACAEVSAPACSLTQARAHVDIFNRPRFSGAAGRGAGYKFFFVFCFLLADGDLNVFKFMCERVL